MPGAGFYSVRFQWFRRTLGAADAFGQKPDVPTSQGFLWGAIEAAAAAEAEELRSKKPKHRATVRLRNYPAVAAEDVLTCTRFGSAESWTVVTARREYDETVCDLER